MKLLIENFRKYLKEEERKASDGYEEVVNRYTDDQTLLDKLTDKGGDEESAASEIIKDMKKAWDEDYFDGDEWDEAKALEATGIEGSTTLQDAIVVLIQNAKSNAQNI